MGNSSPKRSDAGRSIIQAATKVHSELGPGSLESTSPACLQSELRQRAFGPTLKSGSRSFIGE